jgi:LuxR family maltose regulon positive regulatory protein
MGPTVSRLLDRVRGDEEMLKYVGEIKAAFRDDQPEAGATGPTRRSGYATLETLTSRELEVLGFLARHLTNREIGSELFISPETVKRHTKNIYLKLSVGGRREAVAKAVGLGILPTT